MGGSRRQRHGAAAVLDQRRRDAQPRVAHVQVRLHLRPPAGERLRSAGYRRPGRLQLPGNGRSRRDDAGQRRRQLVRVVPARRRGYRQDRNHPLSAAGLSLLRRSTRRTTGASTTSWCSTTACATSSRSRRWPAAISTRTFRRPSRIRPSTTILARWCLPATGPGREGTSSLIPGLLRRAGAARQRRVQRQRQDDRPRRRRSIVRPRHGRPGQQSLRRVHRPVRVRVARCRRHAGVQPGSGPAGLSAAAADRSGVLEQQRTWTGSTVRPPAVLRCTTTGRCRSSAKCGSA